MNKPNPHFEAGAALCKSLPLEERMTIARAFLRAYDAGLHDVFEEMLLAADKCLRADKEVNK